MRFSTLLAMCLAVILGMTLSLWLQGMCCLRWGMVVGIILASLFLLWLGSLEHKEEP